MKIGIPTEIKVHEYRVPLTPAAVETLVAAGHQVLIQDGAGAGAGFENHDYDAVGASRVASGEEIYREAELVVKVKEPMPEECRQLRPGQLLFAYLHLAANRQQADLLQASGGSAIAFETLKDGEGRLPLLMPMSEIAGRLAAQAGATYLQREHGGRGVLLSGATGVPAARVAVIGGGSVGVNAATIALAMGAHVDILDLSPGKIETLAAQFKGDVDCRISSPEVLAASVAAADLVVGAVLIPGARAPKVLTRAHIGSMNRGAVFVDVAIDQGGCSETSRVTNYQQPTYVEQGVIHYCVGNMPAAVPRTASQALSAAVLPYVLKLADLGSCEAALSSAEFASGFNIHAGEIVNPIVREALG